MTDNPTEPGGKPDEPSFEERLAGFFDYFSNRFERRVDEWLYYERRDRFYRLVIHCIWIAVAVFAIGTAGYVLVDHNRQTSVRLTVLEARVKDLSEGTSVSDAFNPGNTTAPQNAVPQVPNARSLPIAGYILGRLNTMRNDEHFSAGMLMDWLKPLSFVGAAVGDKEKVVDEIVKKAIEVGGDLTAEAGKKAIGKMFGEPEAKSSRTTQSQTQTQVCMLEPSKTAAGPGGTKPPGHHGDPKGPSPTAKSVPPSHPTSCVIAPHQ
jgi:hypothetical protein